MKSYDYEQICAHYLNTSPKVGSTTLIKLYKHFGSFSAAWQNLQSGKYNKSFDYSDFAEIYSGFDQKQAFNTLHKMEKQSIRIILFNSKHYPQILNEIPDKPAILYCRGNIQILQTNMLGIVGSRKISNYGKITTPLIIKQLTHSNLTIVSGLALGVDSIAHISAINNNLPTVAVLPSGVDDSSIYPRTNFALAQKIIQKSGLLISENAPDTPMVKYLFPVRNRIIAGLSRGTLIIEASEISGALHTARASIDYNRDVFALPGDIHRENSIGPNKLIQLGARLITSGDDILQEWGIEVIKQDENIQTSLTNIEQTILDLLDLSEPTHVDKILASSKLNTSLVNSTLTLLEIKGLIKNLGNSYFIKIN